MLSVDDLFKGRHFDREIIILCVRWYLRYKLSFRDLVEMMAERGLSLAHTTVMRWVQRYVPECEKRWNRFARQAGGSWRVDETYVKIKGRWVYLYRAVDKAGKPVDFLLRAKRDVAAAKAFLRRAFASHGRLPRKITLDGYQASHRAARELLAQHRDGARTRIRSSKYLNNLALVQTVETAMRCRIRHSAGIRQRAPRSRWFWRERRERDIIPAWWQRTLGQWAMPSVDDLFKGRHFDREIIVLCVRWYLRYKLSFRDLVEMMAERGLSLAHTTIMRWVQRYVPEFEKRWNRFARQVGGSWRVDETYVKIKGRWVYLYRAVDKAGKTVDFLLRAKRDVAAAKAFFRRAFARHGRPPGKITLDGYQASHRAARELLTQHRAGGVRTRIRSSKYLNNLIEQDHRSIKLRLGPMLGFKRFRHAAITIAGVELMHRIRKGQFALSKFRAVGTTAPEIWSAVLAA